MAIKTIKIYATSKGYRNTNVWCDSSTKAVRAVEAYPNGGLTIFENLLTQYKSATVNISYRVNNSTKYGYSGSNFKVSAQYVGDFSSSKNVSYPYTGTGTRHINGHSIIKDGALKPFDGSVGWSGEDDVQSYSCSVSNAYIEFQIEVPDPTIENLTVQGNFWERDIGVNWRSQNQAGYEYELYYNNVKIKDGTGTTSNTFTIPANTFTGTLPASVRVRTYNTDDEGIKYYSDWEERAISLKDIEATISNLLVTGEYWEEDITLSWQSTDQGQLKIEVWKDNILQKTYTGTTDTRYTISKNTLVAGTYLFKVWVGYANRFVNNQSKNVTLKNITPTVDNLSLSGSNIDYNLILSWVSTYQSKAILAIYKGDSKVNTINLTTEKSYTIANNILTSGAYTFKVKVAYTGSDGDRWTGFKQLNTTLVETESSIGALQPDGTTRDKDTDIEVWWTSQNQTKYTLKVGNYTYNGGTEKTHTIPAGTFTNTGDCTITLEVVYVTSNQVEKKVEKQVKFILTGKPSMPTITSASGYAYNRPVIMWDSVGQQGFICIIEDVNGNELWSSDWQNGLINRVKCMNYLKNGVYNAKVQIMNNTLERSDIAVKEITINSIENVNIELSVVDVEFGKRLYWTNEDAHYQYFYIVRNGEVIAKTDKLEYYDYACKHGENAYTVRGVTGNDTFEDSNNVGSDFKLPYATLATVSMKNDCINSEIQRDNHSTQMSHSINSTTIYLNGRENPIVIVGEHITEEYSINFVSRDCKKFISMCDRRETFVHRDRLGNVTYLSITNPSLKVDKFGGIYTCTGLKVDYREVIDYD